MKNEYSLLNDVDIDFTQYEIEEVSEFEKKKMMCKFKNTKNKEAFWNKKKVISAAVIVFMAINLSVHSDNVLAAVEGFKYNINSWLGLSNDGQDYSAKVGEKIEGKGIKLTLNEFFADDSRIIINVNISDDNNKIYDETDKLVPDIYINDKRIIRRSDYLGYRKTRVDENNKESNVILELEMEEFTLDNNNDVKLVFSSLTKECDAQDSDFTYSFSYDSTSYKNASKVIEVNKCIAIDDNNLSIDNVTVTPDRVLISGSSEGFSIWKEGEGINYHYDVVDENGDEVPMKEEMEKGGYFYRYYRGDDLSLNEREASTIRIVPYTFNKIDTNATSESWDGRTKYIIEDKIITISLK